MRLKNWNNFESQGITQSLLFHALYTSSLYLIFQKNVKLSIPQELNIHSFFFTPNFSCVGNKITRLSNLTMADLFELFFDQKFTAQPVICKYIQFRYLKGEKVIDFSELFLLVYKSWSALWLALSLNHLLRKLFFPILSCIQFINSTEKSNGRVKKA